MTRVKKTFEIETSPSVMERIERFFALLHHNSNFGHSGLFAMPLDGDGADKVVVSPKPGSAHEVDLCGSIGGDVEIANNGGYMAKNTTSLPSFWIVKTSATLYKNGEVHKTLPSDLHK